MRLWNDALSGGDIRTVISKATYLAVLLVTWAVISVLMRRFLIAIVPATNAEFYAMTVTLAQLFVTVFFWTWLRHVYRSEGGRSAALALVLLGFALAFVVVVAAHVFA